MIGPPWPHAGRLTLRTAAKKITSSRMNAAAQARLKATATTNEDDVNQNETRTQSRNSRNVTTPWDDKTNGSQSENDVTNDLQDAGNVSNRGADITVPGISEKENSEENSSPRGGRYNIRPNPNPNFLDEYR